MPVNNVANSLDCARRSSSRLPTQQFGAVSPDFVAQLAAVLGVPLEVLHYYAGRRPSDKKTGDPSHEQIVAAYRAFRKEIDKKRR